MNNILEFLRNVFNRFRELSLTSKIVVISSILAVVVAVVVVVLISRPTTKVLLYPQALSPDDFARITKKLTELNIPFETRDNKFVLVSDEETKQKAKMRLAWEGIIPNNIKGFELFDVQSFTTTDFERNVNLHRAIVGEIERHLKMIDDIEDVKIVLPFQKERLFKEDETEKTASVVVTPSPYSDLRENKNKVKAIVELVARGIDGLKPENIVVVDNQGNVLSDLLLGDQVSDDIRAAREQIKVKERIKRELIERVHNELSKAISEDRIIVSAEVDMRWDKKEIQQDKVIPTVVKQDNPLTPYDESQVEINVPISKKTTKEDFKGPAYIPEGPPGVEANVPPGIKEKIDKFTTYQKNEEIVNYELSKEKVNQKNQPYDINRVSVAVAVDGVWEVELKDGEPVLDERGRVKRKFTPPDEEELRRIEEWVKRAIGYNPIRGDSVVVTFIKFDRTKQFQKEDEELLRRYQIRRILIATILVLIVLFLLLLLYRAIMKEVARRRRLREEELARQQQLMREAALRAAEQEGAMVELSVEEKARMELLESIISIAREKPDIAARVIRTWISEE
ncbi:MAG: flagellar basal-body MS-ring/collar protein FliF [Spirochaetia bacterium]|nr:flagellar basal-body MS-ring/collar protein FliF [Spirochaetota bacterium]MDW8111879.1 flagellar basal-body MS-ring/collar protein FliF [Spirochaetia bacterium]